MQNLTPEELQCIHAELLSGESLKWAGKPNRSVIFHRADWFGIPFSLMWAGGTAFWEVSALGFPSVLHQVKLSFFSLWGIPFILIGQYMLWFRFFYTDWRKRNILYAVTSRRVISILSTRTRNTVDAYITALPGIQRQMRKDGVGTLIFGNFADTRTGRSYAAGNNLDPLYLSAGSPVFADIDDAQAVYALIQDLRAAPSSTSPYKTED